MKRILLVVTILSLTPNVFAQVPIRMEYDFSGLALATVQQWTPVLYVNGTRFAQPSHTCAQASPTLVTCSFAMPNVTSALTPSGPQTFEVAAADVVLGEGPRSAPLARTRPGAPAATRFVLP